VAILKVLGFVRMQVGAAVCSQSTTVAIVGTVLAVGIAAGRVIWRAFASNLGVVPSMSRRCASSWCSRSGC
jgi:hypothetical protein